MRIRPVLLALGGLVLGALAGLLLVPGAFDRLVPRPMPAVTGQALVGGPFSLTDHTGKPVTDRDYRGRFMLVFFGFTFCPDVCPTALQVTGEALDRLGAKARRIQPLLITLDPERDTPQQLAGYVSSFHPSLIGLTGPPEAIAAVARAYRVVWKKVKDDKSSAGYTIDHTSIIYLMGPDGRFLAHFTHATPVDAIVKGLEKHL